MKKFFSFVLVLLFLFLAPGTVNAFTFTQPLNMQSRGNEVSELQFLLSKEGFFKGAISVNYGVLTVGAVRKLQEKLGLKPDGSFGPLTLAKVNSVFGGVVAGAYTKGDETIGDEKTTDDGESKIGPNLNLKLGKVIFLAGGNNINTPGTGMNDVYASFNMYNWDLISPHDPDTRTKWTPRYYPETFFFKNRYWVIGEWTSWIHPAVADVWSSTDGVTWQLMTSSAPFEGNKEYRVAVYNGKIYVTGGASLSTPNAGNVWSSPDGINWTHETSNAAFGPISRHMMFVFNNKLYVAGGSAIGPSGWTLGDPGRLYSSVDGINWIHETNNLPALTDGGKAFVHNGTIFLFGPIDNNVPVSGLSVWYSTDGINWAQYSNATITTVPQQFPDMVAAGGKLWLHVMDPSWTQNIMYSSPDGFNWTLSCTKLPWTPRFSFFNSMISNGVETVMTDPCVSGR